MTTTTQSLEELASFGPGGLAFGCGLLGATGSTPEDAQRERLLEIERRILAIEEILRTRASEEG